MNSNEFSDCLTFHSCFEVLFMFWSDSLNIFLSASQTPVNILHSVLPELWFLTCLDSSMSPYTSCDKIQTPLLVYNPFMVQPMPICPAPCPVTFPSQSLSSSQVKPTAGLQRHYLVLCLPQLQPGQPTNLLGVNWRIIPRSQWCSMAPEKMLGQGGLTDKGLESMLYHWLGACP